MSVESLVQHSILSQAELYSVLQPVLLVLTMVFAFPALLQRCWIPTSTA